MKTTRSNLKPAVIYAVKDGKSSGVPCMFNPYEYSISKQNSYKEEQSNSKTSTKQFSKVGSKTLKLNLLFDTYEEGTSVTDITNRLWTFMEPVESEQASERLEPPRVAFEWGNFCFEAHLTSMTQKFTLFTHEGTPVRADVQVTFDQFKDPNDLPQQNPTSGGGPISRVWRVRRGDRLDLIAAEVYGDATRWRKIADYNQLTNPLALRPGLNLRIPLENSRADEA